MKIRYNAPVTLTFALLATIILLLDQLLRLGLTQALFIVPGRHAFTVSDPVNIFRLFSHVLGHVNWEHLLGNFAIILLIGPILEEKYGTLSMLAMIITTAFVTGILNVILFPTGLLGASGVVFMMILLASFTNIRNKEIPLTFILILIIYLAREFLSSFQENEISEFAHIVGGLCGSMFGFIRSGK